MAVDHIKETVDLIKQSNASPIKETQVDISQTSAPAPAPAALAFNFQLAMGLLGVLLAAMIAGLNNRVPGLVLVDIQGTLGFAKDHASWLNTVYMAGELAAMPFATWFAITYSMKRFLIAMLSLTMIFAAIIPFVENLHVLLSIRTLQGLSAGALIPVLMMAALKFLPASIRLHGLALYALTATFSPNVALWIAALCVDHMQDWRWVYWHVIPVGFLSIALVFWGVPKMPLALGRLKEADWFGMFLGIPGLALFVIAIDQGLRLDWFNSPLIQASMLLGVVLIILFLITEWKHPAPFIKLQLLKRRNLGLGFSVFFILLIIMSTAVVLPINTMSYLHGFRLEQSSMIGLMVGLPQLILGSVVSYLLYRKWVDARILFAIGLGCIAIACWLGSQITSAWMIEQFIPAEIFQIIGQPLTVVSLLFLATSVVQPAEGPYVSGIINTLRALGTVVGSGVIGEIIFRRTQFHHENLLGNFVAEDFPLMEIGALAESLNHQATVLATADIYRIFFIVALILIPVVLRLQYIPAPKV